MQQLLNKMRRSAGYRERTVVEMFRDGMATMKMIQGGTAVQFNYSSDIEYQDANGATFDLISERWIN